MSGVGSRLLCGAACPYWQAVDWDHNRIKRARPVLKHRTGSNHQPDNGRKAV